MNEAETAMPLYPTQIAPHRAGGLTAWRDGSFGERATPSPHGQSLRPYDNGIFGGELGQLSAEHGTMVGGGPLRAYRDGLFNRVKLTEEAPYGERVTAFHDGVFGGAVGQNDGLDQNTKMALWVGAGVALVGIAAYLMMGRKR